MVDTIKVVRLFISSPGDMQEERSAISKICEEINRDLGRLKGFRIEPILWETHSYPGIADRSQKVIATQTGRYDIYFGLMGFYFGSTTGAYASGTEEEFREALVLFDEGDVKRIQFYFSNASVSPRDIDQDQFVKVEDFREEIGSMGVFYRQFRDLDELTLLARNAILTDTLSILETSPSLSGQISQTSYSGLRPYQILKSYSELFKTDPKVSSDLLLREAAEDIELVGLTMSAGTEKITRVGKCFSSVTKEANAVGSGKPNIKPLNKKIEDMYSAVRGYSNWVSENIGIMEQALTRSLEQFQRGR